MNETDTMLLCRTLVAAVRDGDPARARGCLAGMLAEANAGGAAEDRLTAPPADATAGKLAEAARAALGELRYRLSPAGAAGDGRRAAFDRLLAECHLTGEGDGVAGEPN